MSVWKRNAVIVAIVLFVGAAVYLNWSYNHKAEAAGTAGAQESSKILGQAALVSGQEDGDALLTGVEDDTQAGTQTSGYFASARLNRQQARSSALELLQRAAADEGADQAMIDEANASIQTMAAYTMSEAQVENLVVAKGYGDCVCFIDSNGASVVVSATADGLGEADVARIAEIVKKDSGLAIAQIKIIEAQP